ncbi:uncharacterized protein METZ01_LOCUS7267, partial [marine metagenome]
VLHKNLGEAGRTMTARVAQLQRLLVERYVHRAMQMKPSSGKTRITIYQCNLRVLRPSLATLVV